MPSLLHFARRRRCPAAARRTAGGAMGRARRSHAAAARRSPQTQKPRASAFVVADALAACPPLLPSPLLPKPTNRQPVFLTLCHMLACASLGYVLSLTRLTPIKPLKSKRQLWKVCLLSTIFCFTIVLGNLSLKYIPISFNQAIGSTTPFFTAIFAFSLQGLCLLFVFLLLFVMGLLLFCSHRRLPSFHDTHTHTHTQQKNNKNNKNKKQQKARARRRSHT
jgi:hypothetical protein